ncbi:hypothetical protein HYPBUDRAFT_153910 [Hyphopichia burtonii NRRL Y-1933]|uniref:CCHC-type domain-containing protein n=1 Tax=Hyphopichia burtonii NRRL Y-1933 TaxID=984485 RepID=A0A1E4REQ8_9ASCO|nr:hypothetical protein HYPBUDRAFT_153910 [Hyphopichia burtonii NRRL Y-1933]ODV65754.1 hypothetical protein HYPBUDRAFT_153910 [Hyphopichia burtonii NRRL Y-1933]
MDSDSSEDVVGETPAAGEGESSDERNEPVSQSKESEEDRINRIVDERVGRIVSSMSQNSGELPQGNQRAKRAKKSKKAKPVEMEETLNDESMSEEENASGYVSKTKSKRRRFYGYSSNKPYEPEVFMAWVNYIDSRYKTLRKNYGSMYDVVEDLTRDEANKWLLNNTTTNEGTSWEEIRKEFICRYIPADYGPFLAKKWETLLQGHDEVARYNAYTMSVISEIRSYEVLTKGIKPPVLNGPLDDEIIKKHYLKGLNIQYLNLIPEGIVTTLPLKRIFEITEGLVEYWNAITCRQKELGLLKVLANNVKWTNNERRHKHQMKLEAPSAKKRTYESSKPQKQYEAKYSKDPMRDVRVPRPETVPKPARNSCFQCGELGHFANVCPKKEERPH